MSFGKGRNLAGATLVLPAMVLAVGGCGSGGAESTVALTKAQFLAKANAICRKAYREINQAYGKFSQTDENTTTEAKRNREAERIVPPALSKVVRELRALGTPSGEEERVDKILTTWEEGIKTGEEDPIALRGLEGKFAFEKAYEGLWGYGLTGCGLGG